MKARLGSTRAAGIPPELKKVYRNSFKENLEGLSEAAQKTLLLSYMSENSENYSSRIYLTAQALRLLKNDNTGRSFRLVCGDGYVSGIDRGSEMKLVATLRSTKAKEHREFKANVKAKGFGFSGGVDSSGDASSTTFDEKTEFRIYQKGGRYQSVPTTFKQVKTMFDNPSFLVESPSAYRVFVTSYGTLPEFRATIGDIPSGIENMKRAANYYLILRELYNIVDRIYSEDLVKPSVRYYSEKRIKAYGGVKYLKALRKDLEKDLIFLERSLSGCFGNTLFCSESAALKRFRTIRNGANETKKKAALILKKGQSSKEEISALFGDEIIGQSEVLAKAKGLHAAANAVLTSTDRLANSLGDGRDQIADTFFLRFYDYLVKIPLSTGALGDSVELATKPDEPKSVISDKVKNALLVSRLLPWKRYFCENSISEKLCVPDEFFDSLLAASEVVRNPGILELIVVECSSQRTVSYSQQCRKECYTEYPLAGVYDDDREHRGRGHRICNNICEDVPNYSTATVCSRTPVGG